MPGVIWSLDEVTKPQTALPSPALGGNRRCAWRELGHAHLAQRLADRRDCVSHFVRVDGADAAHPERLHAGELAGIQDVAAGLHALVESTERIGRIARRVERHDDRPLHGAWQEALEAERRHAGDEGLEVGPIARAA